MNEWRIDLDKKRTIDVIIYYKKIGKENNFIYAQTFFLMRQIFKTDAIVINHECFIRIASLL